MKKLIIVSVFILSFFLIKSTVVESSASGSRMLREIVAPDQTLKRVQGLPLIISKKRYGIALRPESMFTELISPVKLTLIITNPTNEPWSFLLTDLKIYSEKSSLALLGAEKIIENARKEYSKEKLNLNPEQEKALAPYIENKMQDLRDKLLNSMTIQSGGQVMGLFVVYVPLGTKKMTVEVIAPGETHKFDFDVIELE